MIDLTGRFKVAQELLDGVLSDPRQGQVEGYVAMFENGREQGYRIVHYEGGGQSKTIAFSENRNSDDIVIYKSDDFEDNNGHYSDAFWGSRRFFRYDDFQGAIDYIYDIMIGRPELEDQN
jgi:hypothetical protein